MVIKEQLADQGVVIDKNAYQSSRANPDAKSLHRRVKMWYFNLEKSQKNYWHIMY